MKIDAVKIMQWIYAVPSLIFLVASTNLFFGFANLMKYFGNEPITAHIVGAVIGIFSSLIGFLLFYASLMIRNEQQ